MMSGRPGAGDPLRVLGAAGVATVDAHVDAVELDTVDRCQPLDDRRCQELHLRRPRRVVDLHDEHALVELERSDVFGHLRPDRLHPATEETAHRLAARPAQRPDDAVEGLGDGDRFVHRAHTRPTTVPALISMMRSGCAAGGYGDAVVITTCPAGRWASSAVARSGSSSDRTSSSTSTGVESVRSATNRWAASRSA